MPGRAWSQELLSSELAREVVGAEQLLKQHEGLDQEIQECCRQAQSTRQEGQQLLDDGLSMSPEVWTAGGMSLTAKAWEPQEG